LETIVLRHQIAVLERGRTRRSCFRRSDRPLWILLSRWWPEWRESLMIAQPERKLLIGAERLLAPAAWEALRAHV
jgi:hypothetical protein